VPELPEVETIRLGLQRWVLGRTVTAVEVRHPRAVRRHLPGADDLALRLNGARFESAHRRGKYLWLPLSVPNTCLVVHLGMSGQLLVEAPSAPVERHLHVRIAFADGGPELRFVDQRTFGGMLLDRLVPTLDQPLEAVPAQVAHIARDPKDPAFDDALFALRLRRRDSALKRSLLDQTLVSGIGNIYADEALFRACIHPLRPAGALTRPQLAELREAIEAALTAGIEAQGATIDDFRHVDGAKGSFQDRFLVHRREGEACPRCGTTIRKLVVGGRGTYVCERCQPRPRRRRPAV